MKVADSIRKAVDDWEASDFESAMLHACNAVDGTGAKRYPREGVGSRFKQLLRESYSVLGPMGLPGFNLEKSRWPSTIAKTALAGGKPDIADIIYGVHRCTHGHGDELPHGFELIGNAVGPAPITEVKVTAHAVQLSDRVIFGLLAVAIFAAENSDQTINPAYYLTFNGTTTFVINEWWGRYSDALEIISSLQMPSVVFDF